MPASRTAWRRARRSRLPRNALAVLEPSDHIGAVSCLQMPEPKVLVANRGEIAVRVIRTCRELGLPVMAVYSDADREALHVELADDAYRLGPAPSSESYLNVPAIIEAAKGAGATLVHPGYGFLAENAAFARAVADAGMTFVGPPPEAMEMMGDKAAARRAADRVGVPTVPGTPDPVDVESARREADRIGFPIAVKAAFGGGGNGVRVQRATGVLEDALDVAPSEAGHPVAAPGRVP